jgi:hypothetical protein
MLRSAAKDVPWVVAGILVTVLVTIVGVPAPGDA